MGVFTAYISLGLHYKCLAEKKSKKKNKKNANLPMLYPLLENQTGSIKKAPMQYIAAKFEKFH